MKPLVSNCLEKEKGRRPRGREVIEELREIEGSAIDLFIGKVVMVFVIFLLLISTI